MSVTGRRLRDKRMCKRLGDVTWSCQTDVTFNLEGDRRPEVGIFDLRA